MSAPSDGCEHVPAEKVAVFWERADASGLELCYCVCCLSPAPAAFNEIGYVEVGINDCCNVCRGATGRELLKARLVRPEAEDYRQRRTG